MRCLTDNRPYLVGHEETKAIQQHEEICLNNESQLLSLSSPLSFFFKTECTLHTWETMNIFGTWLLDQCPSSAVTERQSKRHTQGHI